MAKLCVLIAGPTVSRDHELVGKLKKNVLVVKRDNSHQIESLVARKKVDVLLFEIPNNLPGEVEKIRSLKSQFPKLEIILIDGDSSREVIARAFEVGASDAFRKPYPCNLLIEKVNALLARF